MPKHFGGDAGCGGSSRKGVVYSAGQEPSFITKFKQTVGYKEDKLDINSKRRPGRDDAFNDDSEGIDDDGSESDEGDFGPQIVVLKDGDLSIEEADRLSKVSDLKRSALLEAQKRLEREAKEAELMAAGKFLFKKPIKRSSSQTSSPSTKVTTDDNGNDHLASDEKKMGKPDNLRNYHHSTAVSFSKIGSKKKPKRGDDGAGLNGRSSKTKTTTIIVEDNEKAKEIDDSDISVGSCGVGEGLLGKCRGLMEVGGGCSLGRVGGLLGGKKIDSKQTSKLLSFVDNDDDDF